MKRTAQDILNFVEDNDVKFAKLTFCDIFGNQKNVSLFASELPRTLREAITVAGQSEFISAELPVALQNKYFEYQIQLCHDAESAPDTEAWERAHSFLII